MTLTSRPLAVLIVLILFGGILFTTAMGWWQTESRKVAATFEEGEFAGQSDPADIRGSYTFGDVEKNFSVPAEVLAQAFNVLDDNPAAFTIKDLESLYAESETEIGTSSVRLFVAFYSGLPFDLTSEIFLPEQAAAALIGRELTPERAEYLESHLVNGLGAGEPATETTTAPAEAATSVLEVEVTSAPAAKTETIPEATQAVDASERTVKGKTTFNEILGWGVPQEVVENILGMPLSELSSTIKDFCSANGLDFETIKPALQAEVDKIQ
jgi:hypothetical protein